MPDPRRRPAALLLAAALLAPVACAGPAPSGAGPVATTEVELPRSYLFRPADIVVSPGSTVTWRNNDQFTHSVRLIDSGQVIGTLAPGTSVSFTFATAGTYRYDCSFHPQNMRGTVTVR